MSEINQRASGSTVLKTLKSLSLAVFVLLVVVIAVALLRGDSWSKWQARAAAKGQIAYFTERRGSDDAQTLTAHRSYVWLLIHQKFPWSARREYSRYITDLKRHTKGASFEVSNERFLTACEFRSSGFPEIAIEEFAAIEAEEGLSYCGLNTTRFLISTLMEMKRFTEAETKCEQLLGDPAKLSRLRKYDEWDPWAMLAMCLAAQGRHSEAEPAFDRAIAVSTESRGTDDFHTHALRVRLAYTIAAMGRNEEALTLARQALPVFEGYKYASYESQRDLREFIERLK